MKIRTDYVTNSSRSLFMVAAAENLSEKAKNALLQWALDEFLGRPVISPGASDKEIETFIEEYAGGWYENNEDLCRKVQDALKDGLTIYEGVVRFEGPDSVADNYEDVWDKLREYSNEFRVIDDELSY